MDEKLINTIQKIRLLAKTNPEFCQEMQKLFGNTVSADPHGNHEARIANIEKYLGLDYYIDSMKSIIDYSFIKEPDVRAKLISDNREMLRYRYGTRFHIIDFSEFCRYAQLQAEMLINYYYYNRNPTLSEQIIHIKTYNPKGVFGDNPSSLAAIPFNTKLWAFNKEFRLNLIETFEYVREVRNSQSHRSPSESSFSIDEYQKKLLSWKMKLKKDGSLDYYKTKQDERALNFYKSTVRDSKEFKQYNFHLWLIGKPFDEIIRKINDIAELVKKNIG